MPKIDKIKQTKIAANILNNILAYKYSKNHRNTGRKSAETEMNTKDKQHKVETFSQKIYEFRKLFFSEEIQYIIFHREGWIYRSL